MLDSCKRLRCIPDSSAPEPTRRADRTGSKKRRSIDIFTGRLRLRWWSQALQVISCLRDEYPPARRRRGGAAGYCNSSNTLMSSSFSISQRKRLTGSILDSNRPSTCQCGVQAVIPVGTPVDLIQPPPNNTEMNPCNLYLSAGNP